MNARPQISAEQHFLTEALEPIRLFLDDPAVVEISCQRSNEVWLEKIGQLRMVRHEISGLDQDVIRHMASRAASFTKQTINAENPLLSATLTGGERVQFVLSPTSATGHAFSIRKQFIRRFDLNDYEEAGAFRFTKVTGDDYLDDVDIELAIVADRKGAGFSGAGSRQSSQHADLGWHLHRQDDLSQHDADGNPEPRAFHPHAGHGRARTPPGKRRLVAGLEGRTRGGEGDNGRPAGDGASSPSRPYLHGELRGDEAFDF